jgi:CheY-like chemotaxis protein
VQEHGGIIELESTGAQGTTFVLYLPVTQETLPTPPIVAQTVPPLPGRTGGRAPTTPRGHGQTILVVDDEAPLRQAVAFILSQNGYRVLEAADGLQAIELVRERGAEVDAVLLDVMMPRLDGVATIKALRELRPDLRAIASSGVHQDSRIEALRRHGVKQFLLKPYRNNELLEALRICLEGEVKK